MKIYQIIQVLSWIVWLLPIFKQKGTEYFSVFYILAIADPVRILFYWAFTIFPYKYFPFFSFIILVLLLPKTLKIFFGYIAIASIVLINLTNIPRNIVYLETSFIHFLIALIICYRFFDTLKMKKSVNLFLMLFIVYEFMTVYKLLALSLLSRQGNTSFNLGTFFQFALALAFTFININTKNFTIGSLIGEGKAYDTADI
jgi:hypothetical protein